MTKVDLRVAWEWTCDDCGTDQFERSMLHEISEGGGVPEDFLSHPLDLQCKVCGKEYEANLFLGEPDMVTGDE